MPTIFQSSLWNGYTYWLEWTTTRAVLHVCLFASVYRYGSVVTQMQGHSRGDRSLPYQKNGWRMRQSGIIVTDGKGVFFSAGHVFCEVLLMLVTSLPPFLLLLFFAFAYGFYLSFLFLFSWLIFSNKYFSCESAFVLCECSFLVSVF